MTTTEQQSIFDKSTLSIVIISLITGGLITLEQYLTESEYSFSSAISQNNHQLESSLVSTDIDELALNAQAKLISLQQIESDLQVKRQSTERGLQSVQSDNSVLQQEDGQQNPIKQVLFAFDSSVIGASYYQSLNVIAQAIKSEPQMVWQVVGYTDRTGAALYNLDLAIKRAQAVAEFLVDKGVPEAQLEIIALGASCLQNGAADRGENQLQRRVEIHPYQAEITALAKQLKNRNWPQQQITVDKTQENKKRWQ